jgi:hypothetical protein
MATLMMQSTKIQVNKLKRPSFPSDRSQSTWRLLRIGFRWVFPCVLALVQFFPSAVLAGQDTDCKDTMRVELHMADRASGKAAEARGFLWQHWSEKKCGELFLTAWSREGVRTDSRYKIGLVQDAMLLTVTLSRTDDPSAPVDGLAVPASGSVKKTAPESTSYLAYSVERIKPEAPYDVATAKVVESTESLPPARYRLRFKDKDGKVITDF